MEVTFIVSSQITTRGERMSASGDIEQFIEQNRHLSDIVESFRTISESDKHWESRRAFIFRNINDYEDPHLDHLLALSMVWANNVFLGCRYSQDLLDRVKEMANGIVVEDAPVFKTRDEIIKNQQKVDLLVIFAL
uniref:XRN2-binding (XTBD) domain-containing protein n=1 Tax=Pygocentrus nattereri TaxID=42514 RepID=A0AAR2J019_PYGNA